MTITASAYSAHRKWLDERRAAQRAMVAMVRAIEEQQHAKAALAARALAAEKRAEAADQKVRELERQIREMARMSQLRTAASPSRRRGPRYPARI